ncbi:MAG: OmpP1/FadL family transporter [Myxococcota bacterium]
MNRLILVAGVLAAMGAEAAGFSVDTQGGRATGMATAVSAHIDDASAAFYNPAGTVRGPEKYDLMLGDTLIFPNSQVTTATGIRTDSQVDVVPPPHAYFAYGVNDQVSIGLGFTSHFGNTTEWPEDWVGRQRSIRSELQVFDLNPVAAYNFHDRVRLGAGFQLVRSTVELVRGLNFVDSQGTVELGGGAWGYGANAGVQVDVVPRVLLIGVSYRSAVNLEFDGGRAHFENVPLELSDRLADQPVSAEVTLPEVVMGGVAVRPIPSLLLAFDVNYFAWSRFQELTIHFQDPALSSTLPKRWDDVVNFHLGGELAVTPKLKLRAGAVYDPTPSPSDTLTPDLPDFDRVKLTAGAGYRVGNIYGDLGYQFVWLTENQSTAPTFPATYSGTAHLVGLTLSIRI